MTAFSIATKGVNIAHHLAISVLYFLIYAVSIAGVPTYQILLNFSLKRYPVTRQTGVISYNIGSKSHG